MKRPTAIQTRDQILCIQEFEHFVLPQMIIYPIKNSMGYRKLCDLQSYLRKQQTTLHGYEQRIFRYIPKVIFVICERILQLCDCSDDNSPAEIVFDVTCTPFTQKFICNVLPSLAQKDSAMRYSYSWTDSLTDSSIYDISSIKSAGNACSSSPSVVPNNLSNSNEMLCNSPEVPSCSSHFHDDNTIDDVLDDGIRQQDISDNDCYLRIQSMINLKNIDHLENHKFLDSAEVVKLMLHSYQNLPEETKIQIQNYQIDINVRSTSWQKIKMETDVRILSALLFEWLEILDPPILDVEDLCQIVIRSSNPRKCLQNIPDYVGYLLEYLLRFVSRIRPLSLENQNALVKRLMASITHQRVLVNNCLQPSGKRMQNLRYGTTNKLLEFFTEIIKLIEEINTQELDKTWLGSKWAICKILNR